MIKQQIFPIETDFNWYDVNGLNESDSRRLQTEFYFTPVAWPDFSKAELEKAIEAYNHRDRRYGLVKEE